MEAITDSQDVVKCSYVFPGQGSQSVGMGLEIYKASRAAREVFEEADDSLGFPMSHLVFNGPAEELQDTINSQPAIMVVSIACWKAWEEFLGLNTPRPVSVAGHSLGEYTSLVVAGAVDFKDALNLVRERGRLMRQAAMERPGAMAAILGLDEYALEHICAETGVELANINSDDQIVISGDRLAIARAMDLASARGAKKTIPLHVSGAFHSSLMSEAQAGLAAAVAAVNFHDPEVPVIANYTGTPLTSAEQVREELVQGLCHCVQWRNSVRYMVHSGVSHFVEFGPSKVLASLIKRIDRDVEAITLSDAASMQKLSRDFGQTF
ncbi:MAG TPA: ACP S-malonyltransferase [Dehalococcoidia bacterium]|jgi:[acyl-carrier-protein] S-malonyltransferase|nr:ACP S-malonyltransferase [Dehalococcoidia bacterium]